MKVIKFLKEYRNLSRIEYIHSELIGVFIPILLASSSIQDFLKLEVIESIIAFFFLFRSGFIINALTDIEADKKYKTYVSGSVDYFGKRFVRNLFILHLLLPLIITVHICYLINNYWLLPLIVVWIFFGIGYSIDPFRFKVRGVLHATLIYSVFLAPFFYLYFIISGIPQISTVFIFISLSIIHYGLALVNQSQDYIEDKDSGLLTPAVRWGLTRTLKLSLTLAVIGLFIYLISIYFTFSNISNISILSYTLSFELVFSISSILIVIGYLVPLRGVFHLIKISLSTSDISEKIDRIKKRLNYPLWHFTGVFSSTIVFLLIFLINY